MMRFGPSLLTGCVAFVFGACGSDVERSESGDGAAEATAAGSTTSPTHPPAMASDVPATSAASGATGQDQMVSEEPVDEESGDFQDGPLPSTIPLPDGVVGDSYCPPNASCAQSFILNNTLYNVDCTAIRNDAVRDDQIGAGRAFETDITVHVVSGFDSTAIVAINVPGGFCSEAVADELTSGWSFSFAAGTDRSVISAAVCEVGLISVEQSDAAGCA